MSFTNIQFLGYPDTPHPTVGASYLDGFLENGFEVVGRVASWDISLGWHVLYSDGDIVFAQWEGNDPSPPAGTVIKPHETNT